MTKKTTLPKFLTDRINAQRAAWKASHVAEDQLTAFNQEAERELCGCQTANDPKLSLAAAAAKNAEKSALRSEISSLADTRRKEHETKVEDITEAAKHLMRVDTVAPLNEAVATIRASRVKRRSSQIAGDILKWTTPSEPWPGTEEAAVSEVLQPAIQALQDRHWTRNEGPYLQERGIRRRGNHVERNHDERLLPPDSSEFLRVLSEQDPAVKEADALPILGGPSDTISEAEFEAVASFLENLTTDETDLLQN